MFPLSRKPIFVSMICWIVTSKFCRFNASEIKREVRSFVAERRRYQLPIFKRYKIIDAKVNQIDYELSMTLKLFEYNLLVVLTEDDIVLAGTEIVIEDDGQDSETKERPVFYSGDSYENNKSVTSRVFGTLTNGQFEGFIAIQDDMYYIEPARKYWPHRKLSVLYRKSDFRTEKASYEINDAVKVTNDRDKRQIKNPFIFSKRYETLSCPLLVYVDHRFFERIGESNVVTTTKVVTLVYKHTDDVFRSTDLNSDNKGDNFGFVIKKILIANKKDPNYEFSNEIPEPGKYLETFNNKFRHLSRTYCQSVAYTFQKFSQSTLGMAYFASSKYGGMCDHNANALFVSPVHRRPTTIADISQILTHELGHAAGAEHDDTFENRRDCQRSNELGVFIMAAGVSSLNDPNNRKFSLCSIETMNVAIRNRHYSGRCFVESVNVTTCGNTVVEPDERCDCGISQTCDQFDHCCTPSDIAPRLALSDKKCDYRYSQGKVCSPKTSLCCEADCKVTKEPKLCRRETECSHESTCDGLKSHCPKAVFKTDLTKCSRGLFCYKGMCSRSICLLNSLSDCACPREGYCTRCCLNKMGKCETVSALRIVAENADSKFIAAGHLCNDNEGLCSADHKCEYRLYHASYTTNILSQAISAANEWFKDNFYYLALIVLVLVTLLVFSVYFFTPTKVDVLLEAKRMARLVNCNRSIDVYMTTITDKMRELQVSQMVDEHTKQIPISSATNRLLMLFPTTAPGVIHRTIEMSTSEDLAVRHLIIQGFPFLKVLDMECESRRSSLDIIARFFSPIASLMNIYHKRQLFTHRRRSSVM